MGNVRLKVNSHKSLSQFHIDWEMAFFQLTIILGEIRAWKNIDFEILPYNLRQNYFSVMLFYLGKLFWFFRSPAQFPSSNFLNL